MRLPTLSQLPFLLAALPLTIAADTLWSDQAVYCAQPSAVLVNDFSATYHRANNSLVFYVSLDSVESGVDVQANVYIQAYGMDLLNRTLNICDLIGGILCPLPQLNVSGTSIRSKTHEG